MDEPFSVLDVQTRVLMKDELLGLLASNSSSVVFVTHDLEEAIALADHVCVLTAGPATVKGIYQESWDALRDEVMVSYERDKNVPAPEAAPRPAEEPVWIASNSVQRYRFMITSLRIALLVVIVGGWEVAARVGWIDPFFFGQPTTILEQIWVWIRHRTGAALGADCGDLGRDDHRLWDWRPAGHHLWGRPGAQPAPVRYPGSLALLVKAAPIWYN